LENEEVIDLAVAFKTLLISSSSEAKNLISPEIENTLTSMVTMPQILILVVVKKFIETKFESALNFENVVNHIEKFNKVDKKNMQGNNFNSFLANHLKSITLQNKFFEKCFLTGIRRNDKCWFG